MDPPQNFATPSKYSDGHGVVHRPSSTRSNDSRPSAHAHSEAPRSAATVLPWSEQFATHQRGPEAASSLMNTCTFVVVVVVVVLFTVVVPLVSLSVSLPDSLRKVAVVEVVLVVVVVMFVVVVLVAVLVVVVVVEVVVFVVDDVVVVIDVVVLVVVDVAFGPKVVVGDGALPAVVVAIVASMVVVRKAKHPTKVQRLSRARGPASKSKESSKLDDMVRVNSSGNASGPSSGWIPHCTLPKVTRVRFATGPRTSSALPTGNPSKARPKATVAANAPPIARAGRGRWRKRWREERDPRGAGRHCGLRVPLPCRVESTTTAFCANRATGQHERLDAMPICAT